MKKLAALIALLTATTLAALCYAGTYLDRAALLLQESRRSNEWLLAHLSDKELAAVARDVAEARVKTARKMSVPKEVINMHPHLLLMLENSERAASSAADGDTDRFMYHLRIARDEDSLFRSLLSQQKYQLPTIK